MKLDTDTLAYLLNIVKTAKIVGIDNIVVEPNTVRAMDDNRTVVLFQDENVPDMPFTSIGLMRVNDLLSRYEIARTTPNFAVEVTTKKDATEYAASLILKGTGTKIDYRCAEPSKINAPRQLNDVLRFGVTLNPDAVALLQKGAAAMGSDVVSIISNDGVSFELSDNANDVFKHTFTEDVELIPDADGNKASTTAFAHRYPVKTLLALFKANPSGEFCIGQKGMLKFPINNLTVYVLPQV